MGDGAPKKLPVNRLRPKFINLLRDRLNDGRFKTQVEIAEKTGIQESHISSLLNANRTLTCNYIDPFIRKGFFDVNDIYDEKPESKREEEYWGEAKQYKHSNMLYKIQLESGMSDEQMDELIAAAYKAAGKKVNLIKLIQAATPE